MTSLPFAPLDQNTVFVCIDMQRVFLEPGEWFCQEGVDILPTVTRLVALTGKNCVFTRFITAVTADDAHGQWQQYYRRWQSVTRSVIGNAAMELHDTLRSQADPDRTFDKTGHDAFGSRIFSEWITQRRPSALVLFGIETDVCVLATVMSAVDLGYRVVIATDAVASSSSASHSACLQHVYPRFDQQIDLVDSNTILQAWAGHDH